MPPDPLAPLLDLAGVPDALESARSAVDECLRRRELRPGTEKAERVAAESTLRGAVASAALDGAEHDLASVRAGTVTDPVLQGALRVARGLPALAPRWQQAPPQVLTKLHILAARGVLASGNGRPPSGLGRPAAGAAERLHALGGVIGSSAPALLRAAVVHGELLALKAFDGPGGVVARAAGRLTLIAAGFDPRGLLPVDVGHAGRGPEYPGAAGAFATGTPDGLRAWIRHYATAVEAAASTLADLM